jgi:hypothetical protein
MEPETGEDQDRARDLRALTLRLREPNGLRSAQRARAALHPSIRGSRCLDGYTVVIVAGGRRAVRIAV